MINVDKVPLHQIKTWISDAAQSDLVLSRVAVISAYLQASEADDEINKFLYEYSNRCNRLISNLGEAESMYLSESGW